MTTSEEFWKNKTIEEFEVLATKWNYHKKLSYDIQKIIPHVRNSKKIIDVACGDGLTIKTLNTIFNFEKVYVTDINDKLAFHTAFSSPLNVEQCISCNLNESLPKEINDCDTILFLGIINYIIDNNRIKEILQQLEGKTVIIRVPCATEERYVNEYSEALESNYESKYRTVEWIIQEMGKTFPIIKHERLYPKDLDSKWNTIQYLFVGRPS